MALEVLPQSHKLFLLVFLFNIFAWSDVFKPEPVKIALEMTSQKLVCSTAKWEPRDSDREFLEILYFSLAGHQPNLNGSNFKIEKTISPVFYVGPLKDQVFKFFGLKLFDFSKIHLLNGGSLRGPPSFTL